jgi:S1-C subfamily serine protease
MFCIYCGHPVGGADASCSNCGKRVSPELRAAESPTNEIFAGTQNRALRPWSRIGLGLFCSILLLVLLLVADATSRRAPHSPTTAGPARFDPMRVAPSVLTLYCYDEAGRLIGQASGFVIRQDGIAVTNWHVAKHAQSMSALGGDGRRYKITNFFNADPGADLVLLQLANFEATSLTEAAPLKIADAHVPQGQRVFTMSSPRGLAKTVSRGLLATTWSIESQQLLVITAPTWRGSSGGPVFNSAGEVVGVIRGGVPGRNVNFAISIDTAVRLLNAPATPVAMAPSSQNRVAAPGRDELLERGRTAYNARKYSIAAEYLERVLATRPGSADALFTLALCHLALGNSAPAHEYLQRFLEVAGRNDTRVPFAQDWISKYAAFRTANAGVDIPLDSTSSDIAIPAPISADLPSHNAAFTSDPNLIPVSIDGLTSGDVLMLLGDPSLTRTDSDGVTTWFYDMGSGTLRVFFLSDRASLKRPR